MKVNTIIAIVLIVLGVAAFTLQGITYTTREKAVDLGPVKVTTERQRRIPLQPIIGVIALAGGIALLVANHRRAV